VTLAEFLTARLNDAEIAVDRLADTDEWTVKESATDLEIETSDGGWSAKPDWPWGCQDDDHWECGEHRSLSRDEADHIVRWQPRRVLADLEAKRAVVAELARHDGGIDWTIGGGSGRRAARAIAIHETIYRVCVLLAQPYRGHPDFDDDWDSR
jgi:hypothetical protein